MIAIIGMAGRFPGAPDLAAYWDMLANGREGVVRLGDRDLLGAGVPRATFSDPRYVPAAALLKDIDRFDANFWGMSAHEAALMDPQQRIMLELAWHAFEDAAIDPARTDASIGVFVGTAVSTYLMFQIRNQISGPSAPSQLLAMVGNDKDYIATQLAYRLDLKGPAVAVQTACSSSLVAVHLACQSLLSGECDIAIAGGVSVRVPHGVGYLYEAGGMLSPDGHCRSFADDAAGTVFGSGAGIVVLRRAADAADDRVRALLLGSAVNNDGSRKVGFTAPSQDRQAAVIAEAMAVAEVRPANIGYVEGHGTATPLGDPVEVAALAAACHGAAPGSIVLGSVKSNIGHTETAAGVAGLIKTVLMLERRTIARSLHADTPSTRIDWQGTPFRLAAETCPWTERLVAGVSSFGIGGTNAHVVLAPAPAARPAPTASRLVISARDKQALADLAQAYRTRLAAAPDSFGALAASAFRRPRHSWWIAADSAVGLNDAVASDGIFPVVQADGHGAPLDLPLYPFQRRRHWMDSRQDMLGPSIPTPFGESVRQIEIRAPLQALLEQHVVDGAALLPGAFHLAVFAAAHDGALSDVAINLPMALDRTDGLQLWSATDGRLRVTMECDGTWQTLAEARISMAAPASVPWSFQATESIDADNWTATLHTAGLAFGPAFQLIRRLQRGNDGVCADLSVDDPRDIVTVLDAGLQALGGAVIAAGEGFRPSSIAHFTVHRSVMATSRILARIIDDKLDAKTGELLWLDESGSVLAEARGVVCRRARSPSERMIWQLVTRPAENPSLTEPHAALEVVARAFARDALAAVPSPARPALAALLRPHAAAANPAMKAPAAAIDALSKAYPDHAAEITLVGRCGQALADVLAGKQDPLALLFGHDDGAHGAYRASPFAQHINDVAAAVAAAARPRRVIEIGGGTAATTRALRAALPDTIEYLFTDVSPAFLAAAQRAFPEWTGFRTAALDISRDPATQGMEAGTFDLVVAANVLHATPDLATAIGHAVSLLAPGGRLLLVEGTGPLARLDITFGLTDDWTRQDDRELRPHHPLVTADTLAGLLIDAGLTEPARAIERGGQVVMTASAGPSRWIAVGHDPSLAAGTNLPFVSLDSPLPGDPLAGVVCLAGIENRGSPLVALLELAQVLIARKEAPRLLLPLSDPPTPAQAALAGFLRTLAREHPALRPRVVAVETPGMAHALAIERVLDDGEESVVWRDRQRHVTRLEPLKATAAPSPVRALALDLQVLPISLPTPQPGEVLIRVRAAGINYKDALTAAGQVPPVGGGLGSECAGEVEAVGAGVTHVAVGEPVIAVAPGALATHVCADARLVIARPPALSAVEGAAVPIAGATAWHAIRELAKLRRGDRVLIHSATGGVGWFALQLARALGAEIVATAGSEPKRRQLAACGVREIHSSRNTDFTAAGKVDVVLNALPALQRDASLGMLNPGGRFIEIGRAGIATPQEIAARRPDISYHVVALDRIGAEDFAGLLRAIVAAVAADRTLLPPVSTMALGDAPRGFAAMMRAEHIGKLVALPEHPAAIRSDGTYVVTGGLGGLGPWVAAWLERQGAGGVIRVGRSMPAALSADVVIGDVSDPTTLAAVDARVRETSLPPVRGVIHAAGILEDRLIADLDHAAFDRVATAKLGGLRAIVERWPDLDLLVGFSSAGALFGSAGQATHTAASAALDAALVARRAAGYPAVTVNWGAWREHGAAAARGVMANLAAGMGTIRTSDGFAALDKILEAGVAQAAVLPIDPAVMRAGGYVPPLLRDLAGVQSISPAMAEKSATPSRSLGKNASPDDRRAALRARIAEECATMLSIAGAIDQRRPLQELGLDSLAALELRNRLGRLVGEALPASLLFDYPTVAALTEFMAATYLGLPGEMRTSPAAPAAPGAIAIEPDLTGMSDADLDAALDAFEYLHADQGAGA